MKRQNKRIVLEEIDIYDLEGDITKIENIIDRIKNYQGFDKIYVIADVNNDPDEGYAILVFKGERLENDEEYNKRLSLEAKKELHKILTNKNENIKIK